MIFTVDRLLSESEINGENQAGTIDQLITELKLNEDEGKLVFAYVWSHQILLRNFGLEEVQEFEINFYNVRRLPSFLLKSANYPEPSHNQDYDFFEGFVKVKVDPKKATVTLSKD